MGAKHHNTERAKIQIQLNVFRDQITSWYIDEKLTSIDIQKRLKIHGFELTVGQVLYALHRFKLKRNRNVKSKRFLIAIKNRQHLIRRCKHCNNEYVPASGAQVYCSKCVRSPSDIRRIKNYGVGCCEFKMMLAVQRNLCGICQQHLDENEAAVDHDHVSGRVRGLLCRPCNLKLCIVEDNVFVVNAQAYLVNSNSNPY